MKKKFKHKLKWKEVCNEHPNSCMPISCTCSITYLSLNPSYLCISKIVVKTNHTSSLLAKGLGKIKVCGGKGEGNKTNMAELIFGKSG